MREGDRQRCATRRATAHPPKHHVRRSGHGRAAALRAAAAAGAAEKSPKIEQGELKLVSFYVRPGSNHLESNSTRLACVSKKTAEAVLRGATDKGVDVRCALDAGSEAHETAIRVLKAIVAGKEVAPADRAFRVAVTKKRKAAGD